jgi:hypothetical protein
MKRLLMLTVTSCAIAAQTITAFGDATEAEKEQIELALNHVRKAVNVDGGCKAMCEELMKNEKTKKILCEMISKDPEARKMVKTE